MTAPKDSLLSAKEYLAILSKMPVATEPLTMEQTGDQQELAAYHADLLAADAAVNP